MGICNDCVSLYSCVIAPAAPYLPYIALALFVIVKCLESSSESWKKSNISKFIKGYCYLAFGIVLFLSYGPSGADIDFEVRLYVAMIAFLEGFDLLIEYQSGSKKHVCSSWHCLLLRGVLFNFMFVVAGLAICILFVEVILYIIGLTRLN